MPILPARNLHPVDLPTRSAAAIKGIELAINDAVLILGKWGIWAERADLAQQAELLLIERLDLAECLSNPSKVFMLRYRLWRDLSDQFKRREATRAHRDGGSLDANLEDEAEGHVTPLFRQTMPHADLGDRYAEAQVVLLLPAVLNPDHSSDEQLSSARLTDMRKASAVTPGWGAETCAVDVRVAWDRADLSDDERAVLVLLYAADWTRSATASQLGMTEPQVATLARSGKRTLTAQANRLDRPAQAQVATPAVSSAPIAA